MDEAKDAGEQLKQKGEEKLASASDKVQQNATKFADSAEQKISPKWKDRLERAGATLSEGASTVSQGMGKAVDLGTKAVAVPGKTMGWANDKFNKAYDEAKSAKSAKAATTSSAAAPEPTRDRSKNP